MVAQIPAKVRARLRALPLTDREQEIAWLAFQGYSNKEIAGFCVISDQTVKDHLKHIYQKVRIHSRAALLYTLLNASSKGEDSLGRDAGLAKAAGRGSATVSAK